MGTKYTFETVMTNVGGGFQPSTNDFVCPLTGYYMFTFSLLSHSGLAAWGKVTVEGGLAPLSFADGGGVGAGSGANTYMVHCSEGERVWVEAVGNTNVLNGSHYSTFSGMLIRADN